MKKINLVEMFCSLDCSYNGIAYECPDCFTFGQNLASGGEGIPCELHGNNCPECGVKVSIFEKE